MSASIVIPSEIEKSVRKHLFKSEVEQGSFLFTRTETLPGSLSLRVFDLYLVPESGWEIQTDYHLQMKDSERAMIMRKARDLQAGVIDCHSHPQAEDDVFFSASDRSGISDFAQYAKWKLSGRPFAAMVWAQRSMDAVLWSGSFEEAIPIDTIQIVGAPILTLRPTNSWFAPQRCMNPLFNYE